MSKWQLWSIAFHMIATREGLDCVEIHSEESKSEERKESMTVKQRLPSDWLDSNRVNAKFVYVHAIDTSRYFIFTYQERQGNKIEVKIEKTKKVPALTESTPPTVMKFIVMPEDEFEPS